MKSKYNIKESNPMYGRKHSKATKELMRQTKLGNRNPAWKGDNVGYASLHEWVRNHKLKPSLCECCGLKPPFDLAAINDNYSRNPNTWEWLCRSCHMKKDGRAGNLHRNPFK